MNIAARGENRIAKRCNKDKVLLYTHEHEEETKSTHRTSSDSLPAVCSTRPRSTQPT
jgi:hypothetical protein